MWYPYFQVFSKNRPFPVIKAKYPVRPSLQTPGTGKAKHGFQRKRGRVIPWDGDETAPLRPAGQHIGKPTGHIIEIKAVKLRFSLIFTGYIKRVTVLIAPFKIFRPRKPVFGHPPKFFEHTLGQNYIHLGGAVPLTSHIHDIGNI